MYGEHERQKNEGRQEKELKRERKKKPGETKGKSRDGDNGIEQGPCRILKTQLASVIDEPSLNPPL